MYISRYGDIHCVTIHVYHYKFCFSDVFTNPKRLKLLLMPLVVRYMYSNYGITCLIIIITKCAYGMHKDYINKNDTCTDLHVHVYYISKLKKYVNQVWKVHVYVWFLCRCC